MTREWGIQVPGSPVVPVENEERARTLERDGITVVSREVGEWALTPTRPEPAYPLACSNCGMSYDACTKSLRRPRGRCCCTTCHVTATHNQHAWEAWAARRRLDTTL